MSKDIILEGSAQVLYGHRVAAILGLALEVNTGMVLSNRGSGLDACRAQGLLEAGRTTRTGGLRKAVKAMKKAYPFWEPSDSVKLALAPKKK